MSSSLTVALAGFVAESDWKDLSDSAQNTIRLHLLQTVSLGIKGAQDALVQKAQEALGPRGHGETSLLGRVEGTSITAAPFLNGLAICASGGHDGHEHREVALGATVVPAVLAAAEYAAASEADALVGLAVGTETALRLTRVIGQDLSIRGWDLAGTIGHIGAAAAASRVIGLDADRTRVALGLGATQGAGLAIAVETDMECIQAAKAASDGIEAAILAAAGFTGPSDPIAGRRAFAMNAAGSIDADAVLNGLTNEWELDSPNNKSTLVGGINLQRQLDLVEATIGTNRGQDLIAAGMAMGERKNIDLFLQLTRPDGD